MTRSMTLNGLKLKDVRRRAGVSMAAASAVVLLAGCGGGAATGASEPVASKAPAPAPAGPVLEVVGAEYSFAPTALKASAGKTTIRLVNKGVVEHDFTIDALKVKLLAQAGKTAEATVDLKPGSYKVTCTVPGHLQSGMAGTLTVS